jgi:hypothetical protein
VEGKRQSLRQKKPVNYDDYLGEEESKKAQQRIEDQNRGKIFMTTID